MNIDHQSQILVKFGAFNKGNHNYELLIFKYRLNRENMGTSSIVRGLWDINGPELSQQPRLFLSLFGFYVTKHSYFIMRF